MKWEFHRKTFRHSLSSLSISFSLSLASRYLSLSLDKIFGHFLCTLCVQVEKKNVVGHCRCGLVSLVAFRWMDDKEIEEYTKRRKQPTDQDWIVPFPTIVCAPSLAQRTEKNVLKFCRLLNLTSQNRLSMEENSLNSGDASSRSAVVVWRA